MSKTGLEHMVGEFSPTAKLLISHAKVSIDHRRHEDELDRLSRAVESLDSVEIGDDKGYMKACQRVVSVARSITRGEK